MENSDKAVIVQLRSKKMEMVAGTYFWCSCGRSQKQPFCDGSHKGTSFRPQKVVLDQPQKVAWCMCKHGGNGAVCDHKHRELPGYESKKK